jgi:hypothetical protein
MTEGAPRWRRDEFAELLTLCALRNALLAERTAARACQRVRQSIRSTAGMSAAAVDTSAPDTATGAATRRRRRVRVPVTGSSHKPDTTRAAAPEEPPH